MGQKEARQRALELLQKRRKGEAISSESEPNYSEEEVKERKCEYRGFIVFV